MWHLSKIPKIAHFYWGRDLLPYLRYVSVTSFIKHNPDWKVILWTTKRDLAALTIGNTGHGYGVACEDFNNRLFQLPIEIRELDFTQFGFDNNITEVHKSNLTNYHCLITEGGVWLDMDIIFFDSMEKLLVNSSANQDVETFVCIGHYGHSGGLYLSSKGNKYFARLLSLCKQEYKPMVYQSIAPDLCNKYFPNIELIGKLTTVVNIGMEAVYAYDAYHIADMIKRVSNKFTNGSIGMHWYGGHPQWGTFFKATNGGLINVPDSIIGDLLQKLTPYKVDNSTVKISIVMAYYNRQDLLNKTMESIKRTKDTNYEIIIIDDGSDIPVVCDGAIIKRIEKKDKWWTNPCIPYNIGFRMATGDIIIIQNPECYYVGDIISYVRANIKPNTYLSFGCYAINKAETADFHRGIMPSIGGYIFSASSRNGWYNHSIYRPKAYHFCSAILKVDLNRVGGFNEKYAKGVAFDDDDFIRTIKRIGMNVKIVDNPYVIHQFHTHFEFDSPSAFRPLHTINQTLYNNKYTLPLTTSIAERKVEKAGDRHLSRRQKNRLRKQREEDLRKKRKGQ